MEQVEYAIVIKPFKTKEEAERTMVNIYEEMHMEDSIFYIQEIRRE